MTETPAATVPWLTHVPAVVQGMGRKARAAAKRTRDAGWFEHVLHASTERKEELKAQRAAGSCCLLSKPAASPHHHRHLPPVQKIPCALYLSLKSAA